MKINLCLGGRRTGLPYAVPRSDDGETTFHRGAACCLPLHCQGLLRRSHHEGQRQLRGGCNVAGAAVQSQGVRLNRVNFIGVERRLLAVMTRDFFVKACLHSATQSATFFGAEG